MICFLLSRSPVSSRASLRSTFSSTRIKVARSAIQRESLEVDESEALRGLFNMRKISSVLSSFPDLPNASSVASLNHATLPICVRRSVVCIPNMSTFRTFPSLCVSLCLLERLYTAIHRPLAPTHLHVSQAFGLICVAKHVHRACLILTPSTRVFHRRDTADTALHGHPQWHLRFQDCVVHPPLPC